MNKIFKIISSVKITVFCLFWLFVLTFWGTVAQVDHGLYAAQERYFFSFFFTVFKIIPIPGAQLVLWILFFNLIASAASHFSKLRGWQSAGLKLSHLGVLIYFVAAFITFHATQESNVHLLEGAGTNVSASYTDWELAYWDQTKDGVRQVTAYDVTRVKPGDSFKMGDVNVLVGQFHLNTTAFKTPQNNVANDSGIGMLEPKDLLPEREKNVAGGIFSLNGRKVLLYGLESNPTKVAGHHFILRRKRYPLPFIIRLKEFKAEFHPGTQTAKSYESIVEMIKPGVKRDVRIFMNNPLREKGYTFYQASYDIDAMGREYSTLAVVRNSGQVLPYIASLVVFLGLAFHFIVAALRRKRT
jgi:hypothetical protein